ncbi:succinate dehydrogenase hydrophobic membrane anchor subunit [Prauserella oleivorans]|uniref:Succinate dehydrogenase hydrophobic membrane anchor subunit n=1 Tax=Prauserella oleivorans TaxID=1478153 RepID=A0ABW5WCX4_9PSEU
MAETLTLDKPRSPRRPAARRNNFELYSWAFMRISGLLLVVLVLGHLFIMNILDGGVHRINFAFVAGRWSSPFWQFWDLMMLWLAQLHGGNGLRTIIDDYARKDSTRFWLKMLLYVAMAVILVLGTLVIFTFDPDIPAS